MGNVVKFDTLRSIAYTSISGSYAALGTAFTIAPCIIRFVNQTDADMIVSTDSSNSTGQIALLKGTFVLYDLTANRTSPIAETLVVAIGTQFYVKQIGSPSQGSVYLEAIYS